MAALSVAEDIDAGRVSPTDLEAAAADECRQLFGTVAGPGDPLWPLQLDVARRRLRRR